MIHALPPELHAPAGDHAGDHADDHANDAVPPAAHTMMARDRAIEAWLRNDVVAAWDALRARPEQGISIGTLRGRLAALGMMPR